MYIYIYYRERERDYIYITCIHTNYAYRTVPYIPCHATRHAHTQRYRPHCHTFDSIPLHCNTFHCIARHCNHYSDLHCILHWIWNCFGKFFLLFCFFFLGFLFCPFSLLFTGFWRWKGYLAHFWVRTFHFPWNLQHFGAIAAFGAGCCDFNGIYNMFEFEPLISMKFATLWCSNCSCNGRLQLGFI